MSDLEDCTALPRRINLCSRSKENVPRRFIKDRQQLESGKLRPTATVSCFLIF